MAAEKVQVDLSKAEPVDEWEANPDPARVQLLITDNGRKVVIRLELNVTGVQRVGNNPITGEPIYNIQSQNLVKMLQWDRSLKILPVLRPPPENAYR